MSTQETAALLGQQSAFEVTREVPFQGLPCDRLLNSGLFSLEDSYLSCVLNS